MPEAPEQFESESRFAPLVRAVQSSDLPALVKDLAEIGVDAGTNPGLMRDMPIVGTVAALVSVGRRFHEELWVRKVIAFLTALDEVPTFEREEMLRRLDTDSGFSQRVGERLVAILDRLDDAEKALLIGRAFAAFARRNIDAYILARLVTAIDRIELVELYQLETYHLSRAVDDLTLQAYVSVGLAHAPHGMRTVHYIENPRLTHPMLEYVLGKVP